MGKLGKGIVAILLLLILWGFFWLFTPSVNLTSWGFLGYIFTVTLFVIVFELLTNIDDFRAIMILPAGIMFVWILFAGIGSSSLFHSSDYQNLLGEPTESTFTSDISPISTTEIRIINDSVAMKLGEKTLGEDAALGSIAEINDFTLQSIDGKLYYIAPLEHSGFLRWWNNPYTNGYIKVSATNMNDVSLVQQLPNGDDIKIVYQPGAFASTNLERHIWSNGYRSTLITDTQFEIDEEGHPWWIVTTFEKTIVLGGSNATGCLVINPETGEIHEYSIEDAPKWIDRIQPEDFIISQIDDWGDLVHGWWNPSGEDKLESSSGSSIVYGNDGECYLYTGITSVGSDDGTVGFLMVNTRTKEVFRYDRSGATESAAQRSAESQVQEKGYHATAPVPYNMNGVATYFMSMIGNDGLPKMYAMVSIENYDIVATGDNINSTLLAYQRTLHSKGNDIGIESGFERKELRAVIDRINSDISDGQTSYYIILNNSSTIFRGSSDISVEIPLSQVGDSLIIMYDDAGQPVTQIINCDNLNIINVTSPINEERSAYFEEVDSVKFMQNQIENADQSFEDLSPEEKLKMMELYNKSK